ncbi:tbc1 domain family member 5 [Anaeramoeba ignava]|uniref:Tbc1 domain family member 5 n=1 Tax=Anaeramoeba ignava TaxID=1746090 RepID=A0A9Q0LR74_ANAIG|nr:tbc1 domain family member 5 [Anaeramoeba ignava]
MEEFNEILNNQLSLSEIKQNIVSKTLKNSKIRSFIWSLLFGCFGENPSKTILNETLQNSRKRYENIRQKYLINQEIPNSEQNFSNKKTPKITDLRKIIVLDVSRTLPGNEFFAQKQIRQNMENILILYIYEHQINQGYKQGMHELLAPIIYVYSQDLEISINEKIENKNNLENSQEYFLFFDTNFFEHTCFLIFEKLMRIASKLFINQQQPYYNPLAISVSDELVKNKFKKDKSDIERKMKKIQNILLRSKDQKLFNHLDFWKIDPYVYLLRWIRLLFFREFHLEDVLLIWDAIFADESPLTFVEYFCVSMLIFVREQILQFNDQSSILKRLLKYPPVEDISILIQSAIKLRNPNYKMANDSQQEIPKNKKQKNNKKNKKKQKQKIQENSKQKILIKQKINGENMNQSEIISGKIKNPITEAQKNPMKVSHLSKRKQLEFLTSQISSMSSIQIELAKMLDQTTDRIQSFIWENLTEDQIRLNDSIFVDIARLKQIKDVLFNRLNFEYISQYPPKEQNRKGQTRSFVLINSEKIKI